MRGVDTNVLVPFLVRDDREQARKARQFLAECSAEDPGLVNHIVLCELVWVLGSFYSYPREAIARALQGVVEAIQISVPDRDDVQLAIRQFRSGADFADALIGILNLRLGCRDTVTFDRRAARRTGFTAL